MRSHIRIRDMQDLIIRMCIKTSKVSYFFALLLYKTKDIIEYLKRLCKTSLPEGIEEFIKVHVTYTLPLVLYQIPSACTRTSDLISILSVKS